MFYRNYLSKTLNAFTISAALLGSVYTTPSWAMEEEEKGEEPAHVTSFSELPAELQLQIFEESDADSQKVIAQASREGYELYCHPLLNRTFTVANFDTLWNVVRDGEANLPSIPHMHVNLSGMLNTEVLKVLLGAHPHLKTLDLTGSYLDQEGALALFTALQTNTSLVSLNLSGTLNEDDWNKKLYLELGNALRSNPNLRVLNLSNTELGVKGLTALCSAIPSSQVEVLDLSFNQFSPGAAPLIGNLLRIDSPLKELNLSHNSFIKKDVNEIASALKGNTSLEKMWMDGQFLGFTGKETFVKVIQTHKKLRFLSLIFSCPRFQYPISEEKKKRYEDIADEGTAKGIEVKIGFYN